MNTFRADLHCHTTCSDGTLSPTELVHLAKQIGLNALSITDHDTVEAYSSVVQLCRELNIELLSGTEFSAVQDEASVHILGYGFNPDNEGIRALCRKHAERRYNRNLAILNLLSKHGMPVSEEELAAISPYATEDIFHHSVGRPHIAQAMVKKGYVETVQEAFKKYLIEGKPCYAQGNAFSIEETISVIHNAKGLAIIAHPHLLRNNKILRRLLEMDFDGIECYYGNFPPKDHKRWLKIAEKKGWLITGGSDFHGTIKPHNPLGCSWIDENLFQAIKDRVS